MNIRTCFSHAAWKLGAIPVTLLIGLSAVVVSMFPSANDALQFDRNAIAAGEIWRLATCHATHWNIEHLQWDLLMFLLIGAICEWRNPSRMRIILVAAATAVTVAVLAFFPDIETYRGLSGIDTALFTLLAIELLQEARRERNLALGFATAGMLLGFGGKTAYEALTGHTLFVDETAAGFAPLAWDHASGAVAAVGVVAASRIRTCSSADFLRVAVVRFRPQVR